MPIKRTDELTTFTIQSTMYIYKGRERERNSIPSDIFVFFVSDGELRI